jgi:ParB family chromosome partitioning protein
MKTLDLPFEQLKISKFNMRVNDKKPDLNCILPSVREKGILLPLIVRPEDGIYGVVAGRTRWFCINQIATEQGSYGAVPCCLMEDGDDAAALEASIIENYARKDPDSMTQYDNFTHLVKMGRSIEGIALTFGLSPKEVKQRLALGKLLPRIKNLFRAKEIGDDTVCHLTMATAAQQKEWLKLWDVEDAPTGRYLKQWLFGNSEIATTAALFPLDQYKGQIVADLFGENSYFRDPDLFWELQNAAVAEKADSLKEHGWSEIHILEIGQHFHAYDMVKTPKSKGGHVYISVRENGLVEVHEGWLTRKEATAAQKAAEKAAKKEAGTDTGKPEPTITRTMENYLDLHRHAVVRAVLLQHPRIAFRLLVAHAAASSGNWTVEPDPQRTRSEDVAASLKASPAQAAFQTEKHAVAALIGGGDHDSTAKLFKKLLTLSDAEVMRVAVVVMADTLETGSDVVDAAGVEMQVDARSLWQPDECFFALLRDRAAINALLAEVGGKPTAKANIAEKGKTQKAILRDFLSGTNGRPKVEGWLPGWMEFPYRELGKKPKAGKPVANVPSAIAAE